MKAENVLKLDKWIKQNRDQIQLKQAPRRELANEAAEILGFKVSVNSLTDVLKVNGIVRMSKAEREKEVLQKRADQYRTLLIKVITANGVETWLRDELLAIQNLDDEVKAALQRGNEVEAAG